MCNKWFLYVVIVCVLSSCSFLGKKEEGRRSPEQMAERQTEMMIETLDLTDEQIQEVTRINAQFAKEMTDVRKNAKGNREQMRASMAELVNRKNEALKKVLTADQFKVYEETEQNRRQKGMRGEQRRNREER